MTDKQISELVEKAMMLGRKEAYVEMYSIICDMDLEDGNGNFRNLLNIIYERVSKYEKG